MISIREPASGPLARNSRSAVNPASGSAAATSTLDGLRQGGQRAGGDSGELRPAGLRRMPDDAFADHRAAAVPRALHDAPGDVLAGPPPTCRTLEQERLATIDRERLDRDERLTQGR